MGFNSVFITEDLYIAWPNWFIETYKSTINFADKGKSTVGVISSKKEAKIYFELAYLEKDVQKVLNDIPEERVDKIRMVYLHECGGITRVEIYRDNIFYSEPIKWDKVDKPTHYHCYGCSDIANIGMANSNNQIVHKPIKALVYDE